MPWAAGLVLVYWFFDRADGLLARCQQTVSDWGAWLDGNVDELVDVAVHVTIAGVLASRLDATWPWWWLVAFLGGKYLLMYGLALEEHAVGASSTKQTKSSDDCGRRSWLRRVYHLPGNADVRTHLLVAALALNWLAVELALVAVYYNLRWIARYVLVARRLGGPS
jgi:phosphatidylglycerophosphate synthase